ncbi:hypothetical protein QN277_008684 [Acacia crassicarpa]|uniref:Uncharacterized protein n=1 Tax=Acacia crassicarpa TaxID=499986 RepID=A0AAE1IRM0_9FABA|nr:hypothetical protein QN277_008684 [Acacia crassicarpa]
MESFNKAKTGRSKINHHNASFKGKFCLCFKPVSSVDDDGGEAFESAASFPTILSSALIADCRERTDGWPRRSSKKKGGDDNHDSFWQILKKAFNHTTLVKKISRRKGANKRKISRSSSIMKIEKNSKQECKSSSKLSNSSLFTRSSLSSSTNSSALSQASGSSSSLSSSTTTLSFTTPKLIKDKKKGTANHDDDDRTKALSYILVAGLLILILWGKFFAIICVSSGFYFMPHRSKQSEPPGPANKAEEEFDTADHKKKVIMEGLLERNRSRLMSIDYVTRSCV